MAGWVRGKSGIVTPAFFPASPQVLPAAVGDMAAGPAFFALALALSPVAAFCCLFACVPRPSRILAAISLRGEVATAHALSTRLAV